MLIERFRNSSTCDRVEIVGVEGFLMDPLAELIDTEISGSFHLGHYSTANRSVLGAYGGIGVSSYISDTELMRYSLVGSRVSIGGFEHPLGWLSTGAFQWGQSIAGWKGIDKPTEAFIAQNNSKPKSRTTSIGSDCWVGSNAVIMSGVVVGHGAVVGAGSVVTKDIPPYAVVVGNPGRILRYRFSQEVIEQLLQLKWWEKDLAEISHITFSDINRALNQLGELD